MKEAVDDGCDERISKDLPPIGEAAVGGEDDLPNVTAAATLRTLARSRLQNCVARGDELGAAVQPQAAPLLGARSGESSLVGEDHRLDAIAKPKLAEHTLHMGSDGRFLDHDGRRNLTVG